MTDLIATLYGTPVIEFSADGDRLSGARWMPEAISRWGAGSTVLSVSMPLDMPVADATLTSYFEHVLPEVARSAVRDALGLPDGTLASILSAIGGDCAGAVTIEAVGKPPTALEPHLEPITDDVLAELIRNLPRRPLGLGPHVRHSLAGVQGKLLLGRAEDGSWALPVDGYPSTHILKPEPLSQRAGTAANEVFCTRLAARLGLTDVIAEQISVNGWSAFVTTRFDRTVADDGSLGRIHQEDLCQAFVRSVDDKYETSGERLLHRVAQELRARGRRRDVLALARMTTFNVAVGNTDAHAKNIALLHMSNGTLQLAPIYDVANHLLADGPTELAMSVNGVADIRRVTAKDLVDEFASWGARLRRVDAEGLVDDLLREMADGIDAVASEVWLADEMLRTSLVERVAELRAGP